MSEQRIEKNRELAHVVQHNVRDIPQSRTFLPHILFEVQEQRRVFFQLLQGEHVFQNDDSAALVHLVAEHIRHRERRIELVLRVPIFQFPKSPNEIRSAGGHERDGPLHLADPLRRLPPIHHLPLPSSMPTRSLLLLMPKLGHLNPHPGRAITQSKLGLVHQVQSERHRVLLKEDDEGFSTERPILTSVHLDLRLAFIVLLNHPAFSEPLQELVHLRVSR